MRISQSAKLLNPYIMPSIALYVVALGIVSMLFRNQLLPTRWMLWGLGETLIFYLGIRAMAESWIDLKQRFFVQNIFGMALFIRLAYVIVSYNLYIVWTGQPFEFEAGDAMFYNSLGVEFAETGMFLSPVTFAEYISAENVYSDLGHAWILGIIYAVFGHHVIVPRLIFAVLSAWSCVLVYNLAKRNFGELPARYAAILMVLLHNSIYYCGLHLKESDMVFLVILFLERSDYALRKGVFSIGSMALPLLSGGLLFMYRTVLGAVVWLAFFGTVLLSDNEGKVLNWNRRILVGLLMMVAIVPVAWDKFGNEIVEMWNARANNQSMGMEYRANRLNGNKFAKYGGAAVFAPAVFVIPLPTMVNVEGQDNQMLQCGGYLEKQALGFFLYIALWCLFFKYKTWRRHLLLLMYMFGYLLAVAMSSFATSERFHYPAIPVFIILVGFGITQVTKKQKKYYSYYWLAILLVVVAWNYIKLAGRGMA